MILRSATDPRAGRRRGRRGVRRRRGRASRRSRTPTRCRLPRRRVHPRAAIRRVEHHLHNRMVYLQVAVSLHVALEPRCRAQPRAALAKHTPLDGLFVAGGVRVLVGRRTAPVHVGIRQRGVSHAGAIYLARRLDERSDEGGLALVLELFHEREGEQERRLERLHAQVRGAPQLLIEILLCGCVFQHKGGKVSIRQAPAGRRPFPACPRASAHVQLAGELGVGQLDQPTLVCGGVGVQDRLRCCLVEEGHRWLGAGGS